MWDRKRLDTVISSGQAPSLSVIKEHLLDPEFSYSSECQMNFNELYSKVTEISKLGFSGVKLNESSSEFEKKEKAFQKDITNTLGRSTGICKTKMLGSYLILSSALLERQNQRPTPFLVYWLLSNDRIDFLSATKRRSLGGKYICKSKENSWVIQGTYSCIENKVQINPYLPPYDLAGYIAHEVSHFLRDYFVDKLPPYLTARDWVLLDEGMASFFSAFLQLRLFNWTPSSTNELDLVPKNFDYFKWMSKQKKSDKKPFRFKGDLTHFDKEGILLKLFRKPFKGADTFYSGDQYTRYKDFMDFSGFSPCPITPVLKKKTESNREKIYKLYKIINNNIFGHEDIATSFEQRYIWATDTKYYRSVCSLFDPYYTLYPMLAPPNKYFFNSRNFYSPLSTVISFLDKQHLKRSKSPSDLCNSTTNGSELSDYIGHGLESPCSESTGGKKEDQKKKRPGGDGVRPGGDGVRPGGHQKRPSQNNSKKL